MVRRFEIITEADARQIERGATVELSKGGHVTPLAQDTLRERRVTVVAAGSVDAALPADLAPTSEIRRVAIASDHTGLKMRAAIVQHLRGKGIADRAGHTGDHYITVQIDVPKDLDEEDKKLLVQLVSRLRKRGHRD